MSKEFFDLFNSLNNEGDFPRQILIVSDFIQNNPNYIILKEDFYLISEIVSLLIKRKHQVKTFGILLKMLTPKLSFYFESKEISDIEVNFIRMCLVSRKNEFQELGIAIILSIFFYPKKYEKILNEIADFDFAENLLLLNANQLKRLRSLLASMPKYTITPEMCMIFIKNNRSNLKKLKTISYIIPNFSTKEILDILNNLEPNDAMAAVFLLNKLPSLRQNIYSLIIQNIEFINLAIFSDQLSKNAELTATFAKDQNVPLIILEKVMLINPSLKQYCDLDFFLIIWSNNIPVNDRESLLRIIYLILKQKGQKINYDISIKILEKYPENSTFLFFKLLVSGGLFLYPGNNEFHLFLSLLLKKMTQKSPQCVVLLSTLIESIPNKKKEYFDFFFKIYILYSDKKAEKNALNALVSLLTSDQTNFQTYINYTISFFIINYSQYPIKIIHFLKKYLKKCEQIYPLMDFSSLKLHNRSLNDSFQTAIFVGEQKHQFMTNPKQTVLSLRKRISYFFGLNSLINLNFSDDCTIEELLMKNNESNWILPTITFQRIGNNEQHTTTPSICFYHMDFVDVLLSFVNKKTEESITQKVLKILDLMPDSQKITDLILSNNPKSFFIALFNSQQNIFFVRYVIAVLAHNPQSIEFQVENLLTLFNNVNDMPTKHDILSLFIVIFPKIVAKTNFSHIYKSLFLMMQSKPKQSFHDFLFLLANHSKQKIELCKHLFSKKKKLSFFVNPPQIIWDITLEFIRLNKIDKFLVLEINMNSKFGALIAENIFMTLTVKDTTKLLRLLRVDGFENYDFTQMLCQSLISSQYKIEIKDVDLKKLISNALETQNSDIRNEILAVFLSFSRLEKYKERLYNNFFAYFLNLESDDYSYNPLNHQKSDLAIKFKKSMTVSPLNSILQNLLNLKVFLNYSYKNETRCWNFFATTEISIRRFIDPSHVIKIIVNENNNVKMKLIDVLNEIDDMSLFEFQTEFPDISKPIFVYENVSLVEKVVTINGKIYKFKGLVGFNEEDNKFYAIIHKNKKLIKIVDCEIELLESLPKEKRFDLVFYCEKKKIKKVKHPLVVGIEDDNHRYKRMISAFSDNFFDFVLGFSDIRFALVYYVKFVVRFCDIQKISIFEEKLKMMPLVNNTHTILIMLIQPIVLNFVKIEDYTILQNFRFIIARVILRKMEQDKALNFCELLLNSILLILSVNPSKLSIFLSIVRDYMTPNRFETIDKQIAHNIVQSLSSLMVNCFRNHDRNDLDFFCKVDIHSVFDCLRQSPSSIEISGLEELANENIDLICLNKNNIASFIHLVNGKYGDKQQFINKFYENLFSITNTSENKQLYVQLFVYNLIFVQQTSVDFLLDTFFNKEIGSKPINVSYFLKELDFYSTIDNFKIKFVQLMPSILTRFDEYSLQFLPTLKKILSTAANNELKACLERLEKAKSIDEFNALEFQVYSCLSAKFFSPFRFENIVKLMETKKNDEEFCQSFYEFISTVPPNDVKQEYIFDIILNEINDKRANNVIEFIKSLPNPKKFILHPKIRDLSIYLMIHGGFEKLSSIIKPHLNPNLVELSDNPPYRLSKVACDGISKKEMSSIISSIFNMIADKNGIERQGKTISYLIQTITSNQSMKKLELYIEEPKILQLILCDSNINENFRVQILNLMIYSIKRDDNIFSEMDPKQFRIPNNQRVLEKYVYFFTLKSIKTKSSYCFSFLIENQKLFLDSIEGIIQDKQYRNETSFFVNKVLKKIKIVEEDYEKLIGILTKVDDDNVLNLFENSVEKLKSALQSNTNTNAHKILFICGLSKPEMKSTFLKFLDFLEDSKKLRIKYEELSSIFFD